MSSKQWKIHTLGRTERWYDPHTRCWWVRMLDEHGNQYGDAVNVYSENEAIDSQKSLAVLIERL